MTRWAGASTRATIPLASRGRPTSRLPPRGRRSSAGRRSHGGPAYGCPSHPPRATLRRRPAPDACGARGRPRARRCGPGPPHPRPGLGGRGARARGRRRAADALWHGGVDGNSVVSDHQRPDVPERGAQPIPRSDVSMRRNAVGFRVAGGAVAKTPEFWASLLTDLATCGRALRRCAAGGALISVEGWRQHELVHAMYETDGRRCRSGVNSTKSRRPARARGTGSRRLFRAGRAFTRVSTRTGVPCPRPSRPARGQPTAASGPSSCAYLRLTTP